MVASPIVCLEYRVGAFMSGEFRLIVMVASDPGEPTQSAVDAQESSRIGACCIRRDWTLSLRQCRDTAKHDEPRD